jgi:uncharacterized protein YkwD
MTKPCLRWAVLACGCVLGCSSTDDDNHGAVGGSAGATATTPFAGGASSASNTDPSNGGTTSGTSGNESSCPEGNPLLCGFVTAHNVARANVSPAPDVALPAMSWDADAAAAAQSWADKCTWEHSASGYGQNIYASASGQAPSAQAVVDDWTREAVDYDYATNRCHDVCGHYTQVVWRSSTKVGCAMKACSKGSPFDGFPNWYMVVCNYSPPGNYVGELPY